MMRALLSVRFRALFASFLRQGRQKKKRGTGMTVLFVILYLYLAVIILGMMGLTFMSLAEAYHAQNLDWLYFAMAGLMGLGLAVIGSVFTTQNQLYDAKDNDLLLSMPVSPRLILLSRMIPLLALNLLFAGLVIVPAIVVYAIMVKFSLVNIILQLFCLLGIAVLAQSIACLFGWLLHLLLNKMNKSAASMLYMLLFLGIYFYVYSQAGQILSTMAANGQVIAHTLQSWVWPLYAMGSGCLGNILPFLAFLLIGAVIFAAVYAVLSATFLHAATMQSKTRKRKKLDLTDSRVSSPISAVASKEWRKFLGCPVYLTNMGLGVILAVLLTVAGVIFRDQILLYMPLFGSGFSDLLPLLICAIMAFLISTMCVSTPSVSLEGKNIWILKSMPLSSRRILLAKLHFHNLLTIPVSAIGGLILAVAYGCSPLDCVLTGLIPGLLALLCGLIGMLSGLKWARLDYISEAYPCKQSVSVLVTMFALMGVPLVFGVAYGVWLVDYLTVTPFLCICAVILCACCYGLYRLLTTWGVRKWDSL